ncbi:MAG TPA: transporter [bacterium]|nr:transporter [bacterium]
MRSLKVGLAAMIFFFGINVAEAHHVVGHGGSLSSSFNPYSSQTRPPETFVDFNFNVDRLDGGLGYVLSYQTSAEYSVNRRWSFGARVPFLTIREKFLPDTDGIGDVAASVKFLAGEWPLHRMFLTLGSEVSFPTGNEDKGTGTGDVMFSPYLTLSKGFRHFSLLTTLGSTLAAAGEVHPSVDYSLSLILPVTKGALPVDFFLSFQGSTAATSKTFTNGSTKAYLRPAFVFHLTSKLLATLGGKFSAVDTLEVKKGIALSRVSTAPLSDVQAGFTFDINYSF